MLFHGLRLFDPFDFLSLNWTHERSPLFNGASFTGQALPHEARRRPCYGEFPLGGSTVGVRKSDEEEAGLTDAVVKCVDEHPVLLLRCQNPYMGLKGVCQPTMLKFLPESHRSHRSDRRKSAEVESEDMLRLFLGVGHDFAHVTLEAPRRL